MTFGTSVAPAESFVDLLRARSAPADSTRLLAAGRGNGLTTMVEDGFTKASRGLTTVDEVLRTTG